jgi:hypothetical protein
MPFEPQRPIKATTLVSRKYIYSSFSLSPQILDFIRSSKTYASILSSHCEDTQVVDVSRLQLEFLRLSLISSLRPADSTNSQSSRLNHLCCPSVHQNYLQNHPLDVNLPAFYRLRGHIAHAKLRDMQALVPQHGALLYRFDLRRLLPRRPNYS